MGFKQGNPKTECIELIVQEKLYVKCFHLNFEKKVCLLSKVNVKTMRTIAQICVAFSEKLNFKGTQNFSKSMTSF